VLKNKGFTLVELLIVVIIIGILATIAVPQYSKMTERAKMANGLNTLGSIKRAQNLYYLENNEYLQWGGDGSFGTQVDPGPLGIELDNLGTLGSSRVHYGDKYFFYGASSAGWPSSNLPPNCTTNSIAFRYEYESGGPARTVVYVLSIDHETGELYRLYTPIGSNTWERII